MFNLASHLFLGYRCPVESCRVLCYGAVDFEKHYSAKHQDIIKHLHDLLDLGKNSELAALIVRV